MDDTDPTIRGEYDDVLYMFAGLSGGDKLKVWRALDCERGTWDFLGERWRENCRRMHEEVVGTPRLRKFMKEVQARMKDIERKKAKT